MKNVFYIAILAASLRSQAWAEDTTPPAAVNDFSMTMGKTSAVASFTMPGDDGCCSGAPTRVEVRRARVPITAQNWAEATVCYNGDNTAAAGTTVCLDLKLGGRLTCNTTYFFAVRCLDEAENLSNVSNSPSATTRPCVPESSEVWCLRISPEQGSRTGSSRFAAHERISSGLARTSALS